MEVTKEVINEIKDKMEQAKVLYLKYMGALEVLESMGPKPETAKKPSKAKK
tara:strand:+ start:263 stop:415 length:153 start_codon:yes stop_codon:yes gene_type:complete